MSEKLTAIPPTSEAETPDIGVEYAEKLKAFAPRIIAVGELDKLKTIDATTSIISATEENIVATVVELLEQTPPAPPHLILWEINDEAAWPQLAPILLIKSAIAIAQLKGGDRTLLTSELERLTRSRPAAEYLAANPRCLPLVAVRTGSQELTEKLRAVGGIDSVILPDDDLAVIYQGLKSAAYSRQTQPEFVRDDSAVERAALEVQRNINLMELEKRTADTRACLIHLTDSFARHEKETGQKIETVLEAGVGEGRVAIPLLLAGYRVIGLDINIARLETARARLLQEAKLFTETSPPVEGSLARIAWDLIPPDERQQRQEAISEELAKFEQQCSSFPAEVQPALFMPEHFCVLEQNFQHVGPAELNFIAGRTPEAVVFVWNTLNFAAGPEQIVRTLNRMYAVLPANGLLVLEIPDTQTGPYPRILQEFYRTHPNDTPGTSESRPAVTGAVSLYTEDESSPGVRRYFPRVEELTALMQTTGFEITSVAQYRVKPQGEEFSEAQRQALAYDEVVVAGRRK